MKKRLKLLQLIGSSRSGGAETFYLRFVAALQPHCDVLPVVRRGSWIAEQLDRDGIRNVTLPFGGYFDFLTRIRIARLVAAESPDIVQTWMSRASRHMPRNLPVKWVARLGGYYDLKYFRGADRLVGNTEDICRYIRESGWPEANVQYLPNFVEGLPDGVINDRAAARSQLGIPDQATVLFSAGRFHANKGFDLALEALEKLPAEFHYLLAGDGPDASELTARSNTATLRGRVHMVGWTNDVARLAAAADIWLVPSRFEPLGNVVLEGWAYGVPVIASDTAGPASLIDDRETGLLVPSENPAALAEAITLLAADKTLRDSLIEKGRTRQKEAFGKDSVIDRWVDFYNQLVASS